MHFNWPTNKLLFCMDETGNMVLHPDFEAIVGDLRYWQMSPPWTDLFPELIQYLY